MSDAFCWTHDLAKPLPINTQDALHLLGRKGATLQQMILADLPVPPGFSIAPRACREYLETGQWPPGLWDEICAGVTHLEEQTGRVFGEPPRPLVLAIRSGATMSMPGVLATILGVGLNPQLVSAHDPITSWTVFGRLLSTYDGAIDERYRDVARPAPTTMEACMEWRERRTSARRSRQLPDDPWKQLRACLEAVFQAWHSDRAHCYRQEHGLEDLEGTSVTIQVLFPSQTSGVLFTQHPTGSDGREILIEAVPHLGDQLVSGRVTPSRICLQVSDDREQTVTIVSRCWINPKYPLMNDEELLSLAKLALRVEAVLESPVDIEWGLAGQFTLFQARPIESKPAGQTQSVIAAEVQRLEQLAQHHRRVWVRHNLNDTLSFPTPLTWDIWRRFMSGQGGLGSLYRHLGFRPSPVVDREGFLELIGGRIYALVDRVPDLFCSRLPLEYDHRQLQIDPSLLDRAPTRFNPIRTDSWLLVRIPWWWWIARRASRRMDRFAVDADRVFKRRAGAFASYVQTERARNLPELTESSLLDLLDARCRTVFDEFAPQSLLPGLLGSQAFTTMQQQLTEILGAADGLRLARELIVPDPHDVRATPHGAMHRVARGQITLDAFLSHFGHRGPNEMDLSSARWSEDRSGLLESLKWSRYAAGQTSDDDASLGLCDFGAEALLNSHLQAAGAACLQPSIKRQLRTARRLLPYREIGKHHLLSGYALIREVLEEIARRWQLPEGGIYFLQLDEIQNRVGRSNSITPVIAGRRRMWRACQRWPLPDLIDSDNLAELKTPADPGGRTFSGTVLSSGTTRGVAWALSESPLTPPPAAGYILVCDTIDPGVTAHLFRAAGLVVAGGGVLSHGALIARQLGIPAVASPAAVAAISDGDRVVVDGDSGIVTLATGSMPRHPAEA